MKKLILKIIKVYQKTISPDHSMYGKSKHPYGFCRFYPSCSQYSYDAIKKFGIIKGIFLAIKRIIRCNPFNPGGYDPVENYNKTSENPR